MSSLNTFIWDVRVCESDLCRLTCGGVSKEVIYLCAVRVSAQQNGLWAATLTEYGPVCKGECTESDLCSARCLRGVKCKMHVVMEVGKCVSIPHYVFCYSMCWILLMNN